MEGFGPQRSVPVGGTSNATVLREPSERGVEECEGVELCRRTPERPRFGGDREGGVAAWVLPPGNYIDVCRVWEQRRRSAQLRLDTSFRLTFRLTDGVPT